jgi:hypothetical protein
MKHLGQQVCAVRQELSRWLEGPQHRRGAHAADCPPEIEDRSGTQLFEDRPLSGEFQT